MKRLCLYIALLWQAFTVYGQQVDYSLQSISDSLKQDAHSIVREFTTLVDIHSMEEGEATFRKVVTILDEDGKHDADFICFADKFHSLDGFKGELYDATGKKVLSFKKSDLKFSNISEDLASDDKTYFYDCTYEIYPYTVIYEWDVKYKHGLLAFPSFNPITSFNQSLVLSRYTLSIPNGMEIDYRTSNEITKPTMTKDEKKTNYCWEIGPKYAIKHETLGPGLSQLIPRIYTKPIVFSYDKYTGRQSSWEELSAWHHSLLTGRDLLSEEQKSQIHALVQGLNSDYEKVKKLYAYLGEKMRYVSIQLGIGGLQPMKVSETMAMGFGDCKALSFYLKVMLQTIGIPSEYVVISTTNEKLYADYPNVQQMNHVILKVPLNERTLWLECTNPFIPLGYVHDGIAGHDALVIQSQGGKLERLPVYADSLHTQNYIVEVNLTDTPQTDVEVECISRLSQYEARFSMLRKKDNERKDFLRQQIKLNRATISHVEVMESNDSVPVLTERYTLQGMYGDKNGNRLFIPVNPFRKEPFRLDKSPRKYDIHLNYGYMDNDTIRINLPEGYRVESLPKDTKSVYPFGHIKSYIKVTDKEIVITQSLYVKKGVYPAVQIDDFLSFSEAIKKAYNGKIILRKE